MEQQGVAMPHEECPGQELQPPEATKESPQAKETCEEKAGDRPARGRVSSPSVATSGTGCPLAMLEGKTGLYFSSLDTTIDILKKRAQ